MVRYPHLIDLGVVHAHLNLTDAVVLGLPAHQALGKFPPVLGHTLVVLSDAHLGYAPPAVETALLEFLDIMPSLGDTLLVNGDLFEFWFAYRTVVPRHAFRTAAALSALARKVPVLMVGGNHDRWGLEFWNREAGIRYAPHRLEFEAGGRRGLAVHGDALRAAVESGTARIRPVLMTAAAMIIGMLPMATANSQNAPLGRAVMGGLLVATLFTLFFVPCMYAMIYHRKTVSQKELV